MVAIGLVGGSGRMGRLTVELIEGDPDLELTALWGRAAGEVDGYRVSTDPDVLASCELLVDFTHPAVVLDNISQYRSLALPSIIGTSGFDIDRINTARTIWKGVKQPLLIVPNFSVGAVLMMTMAEMAAPHLKEVEIVETHHAGKPDAPSGTALATAQRIAQANSGEGKQNNESINTESEPRARGQKVAGVPVHSLRLEGFLAKQEVIFSQAGESLIITHQSQDYCSFGPGILLAIKSIGKLEAGVTVGLDRLLEFTFR